MTPPQRAFLVAPLAAPLVFAVMSLLEAFADPVRRPWAAQNLVGGLIVILTVGAPVAYVAALGLGAPGLWLLSRAGPMTRWQVLMVGAVLGLAVASVLTPLLDGDLIRVPLGLWRGALIGTATAGVWWWLAFPGQPEQRRRSGDDAN